MTPSRRTFLRSGALFLASSAPLGSVVSQRSAARAQSGFQGYGDLVPDPAGILDLPAGFQYRVLSREGDALSDGGVVPSYHDGMAAFSAGPFGTWLVRNHELDTDLIDRGRIAVGAAAGHIYDPSAPAGTTTLFLDRQRRLLHHRISLSGTASNCSGGPTPWRSWLSCEETEVVLQRRHGYVFEIDPLRGGNPQPIFAMGRFRHEAVSFDLDGRAYLTEDAAIPFGCFYRFTPNVPLGGRGSLHAGGALAAMSVSGISADLSEAQDIGTRLPVTWISVPNPNPDTNQIPVREQVIGRGATPIRKAEGTWQGTDGQIWFVSSYAGGPDSTPDDRSAVAHSGQIWRYDPALEQITLVAYFPLGSAYERPDNLCASPYRFAIACTDGEVENWLLAIGDDGSVHPFAYNALSRQEMAGATFSSDGRTLFANIQDPGLTLAIWGPWAG